jgi:DNA-binding response OmpR family regulator
MKTALIFEKDAETRIALVRILGRLGWEVDATHDFGSAVRCFRKRRLDIVLLGWPGYEGMLLLTTVKADHLWRTTPVILMPDVPAFREANAAVDLGANDVLRKPFSVAAVRIITDRWVIDQMDSRSCSTEY